MSDCVSDENFVVIWIGFYNWLNTHLEFIRHEWIFLDMEAEVGGNVDGI